MKEKRWEVLLSMEIRGERDGTIWLGEGGNETVVIHSRRTAIILRGDALRAWKAMDQKREHTERTTAVTVRATTNVERGGAPVGLHRREVEHQMPMCPKEDNPG